MQVLILGAGTIGASVAGMLCQNRHTVTIIEKDPKLAARIDELLDARVLIGSASQSSLLFQAGAMTTDLCISLTGSDECNILSAAVAKAMGARRAAARVNASDFHEQSTFDYEFHFGIDRLINSSLMTALELARRIREPGAMIVENFARGELEMQDIVITRASSATGIPLSELRLGPDIRLGSINRDGKIWIATAADKIEVGDRISFFGTRDSVESAKNLFHIQPAKKRSIIIAGGGETGLHLAGILERRRYNVKVMEADPDRCQFLSGKLKHTTVVHRDARRRYDLEEEQISDYDIFVSCMGDDENNILSCVEASVLGAKQIMSVIERPDYANVIERVGIHIAVSPREVLGRQVLGLLNTGATIFRNSYILGGGIEVLEMEVQEDAPITRGPLKDVTLPKQSIIAAIIGEGYVRVPGANYVFRPGDTVVALVNSSAVQDFVQSFRSGRVSDRQRV